MPLCTFGLTGEVGEGGFGATTLDGSLVVFTHPEFYRVAGLPPDLTAVEATARQAAEYARIVRLVGFVINPGTHQRFVSLALWDENARAPEPPTVPPLAPMRDVPEDLVAVIQEAAQDSGVEAVWLAEGAVVATRPHPDPAFEAGLLARDVRLRSYGASLWWPAAFAQEGRATAKAAFSTLREPLDPALAKDLHDHAVRHGLRELWAFQAAFEGQPSGLALAFAPHPSEPFARDFDVLHSRHRLGDATVPLLDAETLAEALPRIGTRLL